VRDGGSGGGVVVERVLVGLRRWAALGLHGGHSLAVGLGAVWYGGFEGRGDRLGLLSGLEQIADDLQ
jgi:hypothetical protein